MSGSGPVFVGSRVLDDGETVIAPAVALPRAPDARDELYDHLVREGGEPVTAFCEYLDGRPRGWCTGLAGLGARETAIDPDPEPTWREMVAWAATRRRYRAAAQT